ncbi:hypothetical protein LOD99_12591 [Oopsacas minuta]|uniref:Uncharacterized protein n=1 Tax=Oopsacas minuta TaxID=111878 RepID=A0AAV7JCG2_9METZ|nr:hypothetical protein LOD99_12591 [Oopsacas minuta]
MASCSTTLQDREHILASLTKYNQHLTTIIQKTADDVIINPTEPTEDKFHKILSQLIPCLTECYQAIGARNSLEFYRNLNIESDEVSAVMKKMDGLTARYHEMLSKVDDVIQNEGPKDLRLSEIILIDVLTNEAFSFETILQQKKYTILVVLVTFNSIHEGASWLERTPTDYQLLSDTHKHIYKLLNMKRSYYKTWHSTAIHYYTEKLVNNAKLIKPLIHDDLEQTGGDVILDKSCNILYTHYSEATIDRPTAEELLHVVNSLN